MKLGKTVKSVNETGAGVKASLRLFFIPLLAILGCTIIATRPTQEMSDTAMAIKAAREVQADVLAPELYRQATEWFFKAKNEYKIKNFKEARDYSKKAQLFAEQAEFEAIRNGGLRTEQVTDPTTNMPIAPPPAPEPTHTEPYDYPTPTGTPFEKLEEQNSQAPTTPSPSPSF